MSAPRRKAFVALLYLWIGLAVAALIGWLVLGPSWVTGVTFLVGLMNAVAWGALLRAQGKPDAGPGS